MRNRKLQLLFPAMAVMAPVLAACAARATDPPAQATSATEPTTQSVTARSPEQPTSTSLPATILPTKLPPVGTDITIDLPEGDAERGQALAMYGGGKGLDGYTPNCWSCHMGSRPSGPIFAASEELPAIGERGAIRISAADYAGAATTPEQYLVESVVLPRAYVFAGIGWVDMPEDFGERLSRQHLADLVAWMLTLE